MSVVSSPDSFERRQFGLPAAIAIVVGESIALGIFLTPATMAKSLGSPLLLGLGLDGDGLDGDLRRAVLRRAGHSFPRVRGRICLFARATATALLFFTAGCAPS